jgi:hypothetical protein
MMIGVDISRVPSETETLIDCLLGVACNEGTKAGKMRTHARDIAMRIERILDSTGVMSKKVE